MLLLLLRLTLAGSRVVVRKTHFSATHRVLFVAGLEGSGHHAWPSVLKRSCPAGLCGFDLTASLALFSGVRGPSGWTPIGGAFARDPDRRRGNVGAIVAAMRTAARTEAPRLLALNALGGGAGHCKNGTCSGMMSYPNFQGPGRPLQYPDLYWLARWAEEAGADLRIVVMTRNARDTLASTTVHRRFGSWEEQAAVLTNAVSALRQQLDVIDPRFFACAALESLEFSASLASFVHPSLAIGATFAVRAPPPRQRLDENATTQRLAVATAALVDACRASPLVASDAPRVPDRRRRARAQGRVLIRAIAARGRTRS